jgi:O-acetylhomoserine/O-acetylserine sulfhydrylase-like pyridoxal-dependent enzyme
LVKSAFKLAHATGVEHLAYLSIDDSLTVKDKATVDVLQKRLAALEGGERGLVTPSG